MEFEGQHEDETVKMVFRRHILTATKGLVLLVVFMALGVVPLLIWPDQPILFWVFCVAVLIGLLACGYHYMLWYFSVFIITDQRIRQINQRSLFKKSVTDILMSKVQSVSYDIPGVFATMFGYGTLLIQAQVGDLEITKVSRPAKVYDKIQSIMGKFKNEQKV